MTLENILADFQLLDDWQDRYRYLIELGRALPPLPEAARTEANKVRGCASQVWLATEVNGATAGAAPRLSFKGDSDAIDGVQGSPANEPSPSAAGLCCHSRQALPLPWPGHSQQPSPQHPVYVRVDGRTNERTVAPALPHGGRMRFAGLAALTRRKQVSCR